MSLPKIIGLTGGIGSGKSTVAGIIRELGYPVYEADQAAKMCVSENTQLQNQIKDLLGDEAFVNGEYNRSYVSQKVFQDPHLLKGLNEIIHPAVQKHFENWLLLMQTPFVFKEAAILFESGSYKNCDKIIVVSAPEEIRIERVMKRDGVDASEVKKRMENQWPQAEKEARADYVINNTVGDQIMLQTKLVINELNNVYSNS